MKGLTADLGYCRPWRGVAEAVASGVQVEEFSALDMETAGCPKCRRPPAKLHRPIWIRVFFLTRDQNEVRSHTVKIDISSSGRVQIFVNDPRGKSKGKVHPITAHEGSEESRGIALLFL